MNVALPALVVFLLVLPGFIFRARLKRAERTSLDYSPFGRVVTESVSWAAVLHAVWLALAYVALGLEFRVDLLLRLLSSDAASQSAAIATLGRNGRWLVQYFASVLLAAYIVPICFRALVSRYRLDQPGYWLAPWVRFHDAPWYYLLTGADFLPEDEPDLIQISAVVDVAGQAVLYTGVLEDFYFSPDGQLDRLVLQGVMRRPMSEDRSAGLAEERFYPVEGDYFVLRYSEAITLNVQYVKLEEVEVVTGDVETPAA